MSRDEVSKLTLSVYFSAVIVYFIDNIHASIQQIDSCNVKYVYLTLANWLPKLNFTSHG